MHYLYINGSKEIEMNSRFEDGSQRIDWTVHVPYLFNEILTNPGTSALEKAPADFRQSTS